MFKIEIGQLEKGRCVVKLYGRLDTITAPTCEEKIQPLLTTTALQVLVFDMAALEFISSMGLRVVFKTRKTLATQNKALMMVQLQPQIAKVFKIAAALPKEAIFSSLEEADRYFAAMQRQALEQ